MVSTCFNSLWISYDFVMPASVSHPLRGWGCAFHPVCWSSHPRKSFAALRSPSSPNHHTTCDTKSWSDGVMGWTPWTNGWCYVCYVMLLCLKCFFAIEKSVETCSLYRFSQSIFNGFSMFDSNTSSSRGFTARFMPQDATGCPRMPQVTWWLDGQLDRPPPISRTARPCHPNNPNPCSRPPDENRTRTGWLWSCEFLISSVTFSVFSPLLLL